MKNILEAFKDVVVNTMSNWAKLNFNGFPKHIQ